MVTPVDTVLRQEWGIADALADQRVSVLDPCCGTGAYLVAVLQRIAATLQEPLNLEEILHSSASFYALQSVIN